MANRLLTILWPTLLLAGAAHGQSIQPRFELVRQVQWSPDGLAETIESGGGGLLLTAKPKARKRFVPAIAVGPDGGLWIHTKDQLGRAAPDGYTRVALDAFDANVQAIAPLKDGVVALGSKGRENVLARLGLDGQAAWRRTGPFDADAADPAALKGVLRRLGVDGDGTVYLYATRQAGVVAKVDPAGGATASAVTLAEFRSPSAWVLGGTLYRAQTEGKETVWIRRPVAGGDDARVEPEGALAGALVGATPLPDGGALVQPRAALVRMGPDGQPAGTVSLAGIVRDAEGGLYVGLSTDKGLVVTRWRDGKPGDAVVLGGLAAHARLAAAGPDGYKVIAGRSSLKAGTLFEFDAAGGQTASGSLEGKGEELLGFEGRIDTGQRVVGPDGAIYLPGVDPRGAYIVKMSLP